MQAYKGTRYEQLLSIIHQQQQKQQQQLKELHHSDYLITQRSSTVKEYLNIQRTGSLR